MYIIWVVQLDADFVYLGDKGNWFHMGGKTKFGIKYPLNHQDF